MTGRIDTVQIIEKYYPAGSLAHKIMLSHAKEVARKACEIALSLRHLNPDQGFIEEASMLHDIGIFLTDAPDIGCRGRKSYICHGYLGREILEKEELPLHALVCERHVGVGLSIEDIDRHHLPLPRRDMLPLTLEEKIICVADKFFSKTPEALQVEKPLEEARKDLLKFGKKKVEIFDELCRFLNI